VYNFSHTLLSKMECMQSVRYYIDKTPGISVGPAANFGSLMHTHCENYLKDKPYILETEKEKDYWNKILPYLMGIKPFVIDIEKRIEWYDDSIGNVVAIFDAVYVLNGKLWLVDWKFVGKPWAPERLEEYTFTQAYLYLLAAERAFIPRYPEGLIYVVVPEKGELQSFTIPTVREELDKARRQYASKNTEIKSAIQFDTWPTNVSYKCNWCSWRIICPAKKTQE
jgi:hypothetical protein